MNRNSIEILIRTNGVDLTEEFRAAIATKIGRVRQYAPTAFRARVHLDREFKTSATQYRIMVHYELPGNDIFAEHRAHEPLTALDLVAEKIERRLRKRKTAELASRFKASVVSHSKASSRSFVSNQKRF